jgi:hypothetical protein
MRQKRTFAYVRKPDARREPGMRLDVDTSGEVAHSAGFQPFCLTRQSCFIPGTGSVINQLRVYDIDPELVDRFLERFGKHAQRIMTERYGFRILAMWTTRTGEQVRFVYLLSWVDEEEMNAKWKAFMADQEWDQIKRESRVGSREPVRGIEDMPLEAVSFSAPL